MIVGTGTKVKVQVKALIKRIEAYKAEKQKEFDKALAKYEADQAEYGDLIKAWREKAAALILKVAEKAAAAVEAGKREIGEDRTHDYRNSGYRTVVRAHHTNLVLRGLGEQPSKPVKPHKGTLQDQLREADRDLRILKATAVTEVTLAERNFAHYF